MKTMLLFRVASFTVAFSIFVGWVYVYPALFPHLDASRPAHFEERVEAAFNDGDVSKAVAIARDAARWQSLDPMAHTVYGNALMAAGRVDEARDAYRNALTVPTTPGPEYRLTRKPFYFPPARLALAALAGDDDPPSSLIHIEFAQPYWDTWRARLDTFVDPVYSVYSDYEWWSRALDYGRPDAADFEGLASRSLLRLGWAAMAQGDYELVYEVAFALAQHGGYLEDAVLLAGMAAFRRESWVAVAANLPDAHAIHGEIAMYYRAQAPSGVDPELSPDSMWSFLADARSANDSTALAERIESNPNHLATAFSYRAVVPISARWSELQLVSPGYFPLRVTWKNPKELLPLRVIDSSSELTLVEFDDARVTYEWVRNEAPWLPSSIAGIGMGEMPGWADSARDWYGFRQHVASERVTEDDGVLLRVTNDDIHKTALLYSNPVRCDPRQGFLIRGEVRAGTAPAIFAWEALDAEERVVSKGYLFEQEESEIWKEGMVYIEPTHFHDRLRIVIGVNRHEGHADFRGLQVLRVTPPPR